MHIGSEVRKPKRHVELIYDASIAPDDRRVHSDLYSKVTGRSSLQVIRRTSFRNCPNASFSAILIAKVVSHILAASCAHSCIVASSISE